MANSLLIAGIVCIVAAVVGGGVKMLGAEMPLLGSIRRQVLLFVVGVAFLIASYLVAQPKPTQALAPAPASTSSPPSGAVAKPVPPAPSSPAPVASSPESAPVAPLTLPTSAATGPATCGASNGLDCLPKSSGPVSFQYPAAANEMAARNVADHLSTTEGQFQAQRAGATGKASRLCGIIASYDSSALGKHLAAVAIENGTANGQASDSCRQMAQSFL